MSDSMPFSPGDLVAGKYRIDRVLGKGGMGIVYAATHEQLDQQVALKFLLPEIKNAGIVERFLREARASVKIQSEHVARVFDVGRDEESGSPYIVMEYLHGQDLSDLVDKRGALPVEEAVGYVLQACEAIAEAHALGIVHRDLKPANLFLATRSGGGPLIKVLDFGISKIPATAKHAAMTQATAMMGSPLYMAPEQMVAARDVDARSDIWSLGVVLYQLLSAELPFNADSMTEIVAAVLSTPPRPLSEARPSVPTPLQLIIARCLEKEPSRRYPSLSALARVLAPYGPPGSALSVQRIDHVLGVDPESSAQGAALADTGWGEYRMAPLSGAHSVAEIRAPQAAFDASRSVSQDTGSHATLGAASRGTKIAVLALAVLIPAAVVLAVATHFLGARAVAADPSTAASSKVLGTSDSPSALPDASAVPQPPSTGSPAAAPPDASPNGPTSTTASAAVVPAPSSSSSSSTHRTHPTAVGSASSTPAPAGSTCHTEKTYDSDGVVHFKSVCP